MSSGRESALGNLQGRSEKSERDAFRVETEKLTTVNEESRIRAWVRCRENCRKIGEFRRQRCAVVSMAEVTYRDGERDS